MIPKTPKNYWWPTLTILFGLVLIACPSNQDNDGDAADIGTDMINDSAAEPDVSDDAPFSLEGRIFRLQDVDSVGGAPIYPEIKLNPDELPVTVFTKGTARELYPAISYFDGVQWSPPETIEFQTTVYLGKRPSLAIDQRGTLHVSYYDEDNERLHYANKEIPGSWEVEAIYDASVDAGDHSSLALDPSGGVHISFLQYTDYRLIYGHKQETGWVFYTVDNEGTPVKAGSSSLAIDKQAVAHIAYYTGGALHYAKGLSNSWTVEIVDDTVADIGHYASLALDESGRPIIVYLRWPQEKSEVRVAFRRADGWDIQVVDTGLGLTSTTGIASLPCGTTVIAYARNEGVGVQGLWLGYLNPGSTDWSLHSVDARTWVSGIDLTADAFSRIHIIYFDENPADYILRHALLDKSTEQ